MNTTQDIADEPLSGSGKAIDFKLYATRIKANWYWFLFSVIICSAIAYLYVKYATPLYTTTASVLIKEDADSNMGESSVLKVFGGTDLSPVSTTETEAVILKTRLLMETVVKSLNANISYYAVGKVKDLEINKSPFKIRLLGKPNPKGFAALNVKMEGTKIHLSSEKFSKTVNLYEAFTLQNVGSILIEKGDAPAIPNQLYSFKIFPVDAVVAGALASLQVAIPSKQVNIINLAYTSAIPEKSEAILNTLIQAYIKSNIVDKNTIADSTIAFIDKRLSLVSEELDKVEGNVETFRKKNKVTDIAAQSALLVNTTNQSAMDLTKVETQLSILNSLEAYLTDQSTNERVVPSGVLLDDPNFSALVERYNTIVLEKEKSKLSQTEKNPYVQNLSTQIAGVRGDMLRSLSSLKTTLEISKKTLQRTSNQMAGQASSVPTIQRAFLDLGRQQQIKQELYVFLLQKKEETAISKTSNISNCKIVDAPISFGPISPNRNAILGYGVILGLFIPLGILYIGDLLNTKVKDKEDVSSHTHVPLIAEIGSSNSLETIVVSVDSRTPISEQFRNLRTNLSFFLKDGSKRILVTSSMSGEGKSFCSINLAAILALTGKKVVVMEMDLRKPNLSNKFGLANNIGYTNYITSKQVSSAEIIRPSGLLDNLFIISSGPIPPNPAELLIDDRINILMTELERDFDYIIMDAPPVGLVTDAQLLSNHADLTLYVVRQGVTFKDQISIPEEIYLSKKIKNMAILLNDAKFEFSYGYAYGYYGMEEKEKGFFAKLFNK